MCFAICDLPYMLCYMCFDICALPDVICYMCFDICVSIYHWAIGFAVGCVKALLLALLHGL